MNDEALKFGVGKGTFEFRSVSSGFQNFDQSPLIQIGKESSIVGNISTLTAPPKYYLPNLNGISNGNNTTPSTPSTPSTPPTVVPGPQDEAAPTDSDESGGTATTSTGNSDLPAASAASGSCSMVPVANANPLAWLIAAAAVLPIGIRRKK